jgi:hypothetical protein
MGTRMKADGQLGTRLPKRDKERPARKCVQWASPRPISTARLNALLRLHVPPINPVIYRGPYSVDRMGDLILGWAWRLDAFSAYPVPTWLPSDCPWRDNWYTSGRSSPVLSY